MGRKELFDKIVKACRTYNKTDFILAINSIKIPSTGKRIHT